VQRPHAPQIANRLIVAISMVRTQLASIRGKTRATDLRSLQQRVADLPALQGLDVQVAAPGRGPAPAAGTAAPASWTG